MEREGFRSEWDARPATMRLYAVGSVVGAAVATIRDPNAYGGGAILFTLFFLALLWKLWAGDRAVWWLFVIASAGALVAGVAAWCLLVVGPPEAFPARASVLHDTLHFTRNRTNDVDVCLD